MSDTGTPDGADGNEQLQRDAAQWCTRMHGDAAESWRPEFETWIRRDARHLEAYNRAEEVYLLGARARPTHRPTSDKDGSSQPGRRVLIGRWPVVVGATLLVAVVSYGVFDQYFDHGSDIAVVGTSSPALPERIQLKTLGDKPEKFRLADGSTVTLERNSVLTVLFDPSIRLLRLVHGQGHFEVAHGTRPFIVAAGAGKVTARGTVFDVSITPGDKVVVDLIRGIVDVQMPSKPTDREQNITQRLSAGQRVSYSDAGQPSAEQQPVTETALPAPPKSAQATTVGDLLTMVNGATGATTRITVADPSILSIRLGGNFQAHDTETTVERLGQILNLAIDRSVAGQIILRRPTEAPH
jgi:transmembrane sensor